ncbi:MAG: dTDP-4-dehydrorhamnose 3,5-epimerase [Myxococcota bacterium]
MRVVETELPEVKVLEPRVFGDARGFFMETWNGPRYREAGIAGEFVQDNMSHSARGVLRGLHLQHPHDQGKLVWLVEGEVFDVAVDVRVGSPTFGRWVGATLSADNRRQIWVPPGFAHGFCVTSERATVIYKCTDVYHPESEVGVAWNDPDIGITWPVRDPDLSAKDAGSFPLRSIAPERLPRFVP